MSVFAVILICLAMNALLAAVEMAFVTVTKPRLRELVRGGGTGAKEAERVLALRENPERTLSVLQIGITAVGAIAAAVGGVGAESHVGPWLEARFDLSERASEILAVAFVVVPIVYLNVVVGELVPKTLAIRNPLAIVMKAARPLRLFDRLLSPAVTLLEQSTRFVLRLFGKREQEVVSEEEEEEQESVELDTLSSKTREYVLNLVDLENMRIRDVRLPWEQAVVVRRNQSADEVEQVILSSGHTRLPVMDAEGKEVDGIINTKEVMVYRATGGRDWETLIRPVIRVEESSPILRALQRMQQKRSHLSITYLNGKRSGLVTVEDIFEEVIGDLYDEDDDGMLRRILGTNPRFRPLRPVRSPLRT